MRRYMYVLTFIWVCTSIPGKQPRSHMSICVISSKSPKDAYQEDISRKYIQTVYSTSDRWVCLSFIHKSLYPHTYMYIIYVFLCVILENGAPDGGHYICVWSTTTSVSRKLFLGFLTFADALYSIELSVPYGCLPGQPLCWCWLPGVPVLTHY